MSDVQLADEQAPARPAARSLGWALVLITVAQLMVVLDSTIANIALPYIQSDLGFSDGSLTWVVTGYALAFGGLLLLGGRLADLFGRRRIFALGLVIFAVASALGGIATTEELLLGARGLQGLGAALASPAALALITTTFPAGPARNRAFGVYAAMSGAGAAVGLILGGWLTGTGLDFLGGHIEGWRLTFLINVPIGLVAAALSPRVLPESVRTAGRLDVPGAITGTGGLLGIVYGLSRAAGEGWSDAWTIASLAAGVALLVTFVVVESRTTNPLLPFRILADRTRAASFAAMMLMPAAMFAMFYFLSLYVQNVMGYSPLETGFAFLPFSAGIVLAAAVASRLAASVNPRFIAGTGTLLVAAALFGFSRLPYDVSFPATEVTGSYVTDLLPYILLMSFGLGLTFIPLTLTAVHGVKAEDSGIGSGVLNTMQQVGGALGLATLGTVAQQVWSSRGDSLSEAAQGALAAGPTPTPEQLEAMERIAGLQVFTSGATVAFLVGSAMTLVASLVVWTQLRVSHAQLARDGADPEQVPVHAAG